MQCIATCLARRSVNFEHGTCVKHTQQAVVRRRMQAHNAGGALGERHRAVRRGRHVGHVAVDGQRPDGGLVLGGGGADVEDAGDVVVCGLDWEVGVLDVGLGDQRDELELLFRS